MSRVDSDFNDKVYEIVARMPKGRITTYGAIAAKCGAAWAAWEVGQIAHTGPANLPWQRVVNKQGGLAKGYPGGKAGHKQALAADGIPVDDDFNVVNLEKYLWKM
ncbi:MGMT family protein [Candidatus Saccharibacteria bacterium]|nr:MGMT family protein [Candidatus Saccharibacteria bacterium]